VGFPRIRYLTHDITGGHEKLALLYLLSGENHALGRWVFFFRASFDRGEVVCFLRIPTPPHVIQSLEPGISCFYSLFMQRMLLERVRFDRAYGVIAPALSGASCILGMHFFCRTQPLDCSAKASSSFFPVPFLSFMEEQFLYHFFLCPRFLFVVVAFNNA
jgi:hypothetical protein